jgi:hypothetical protein
VVRNIAPDFNAGTVDFDLFNAGTQNVATWNLKITFYAADGSIAGTHWEGEDHVDVPDQMLLPGTTKHYEWKLSKLDGAWPSKVSIDVSAFILADNTAYGEETGIQLWTRQRKTESRIAKQLVELLEKLIASADPLGTIKQELQKLPPDEAVPVAEREPRYMLNKAQEILQGGHPEGLQNLLEFMRKRTARAERNMQIQRGVKP